MICDQVVPVVAPYSPPECCKVMCVCVASVAGVVMCACVASVAGVVRVACVAW